MNSREFFYLVAEMRSAQQAYFETRSQHVLRACKMYEKRVDQEIARVRKIVNENAPEDL